MIERHGRAWVSRRWLAMAYVALCSLFALTLTACNDERRVKLDPSLDCSKDSSVVWSISTTVSADTYTFVCENRNVIWDARNKDAVFQIEFTKNGSPYTSTIISSSNGVAIGTTSALKHKNDLLSDYRYKITVTKPISDSLDPHVIVIAKNGIE